MKELSRQQTATGYTWLAPSTPLITTETSVAEDRTSVNRDVPSPEQGYLPLLFVVEGGQQFPGYNPLYQSETTYAYNQFLTQVAPSASLCCTRLVGYMMFYTSRRSTWRLEATVPAIAETLNCSERSVYNAVHEAEAAGYIRCVREPRKSERGCPALPGIWIMNLTNDTACISAEKFSGFYAGNAYRTPLPNRFLLETLLSESITVIRYLCCIMRYTIGFKNDDGSRRLTTEIGVDKLAKESGIRNKTRLNEAKTEARERRYADFYTGGKGGRMIYGLAWSQLWDGHRGKNGTPGKEEDPGNNGTPSSGEPGKSGTPLEPPQQNRYPRPGNLGTPSSEDSVPPAKREDPGKNGTPINKTFPSKQGLGNRQQKLKDELVACGMDAGGAAAVLKSYEEETVVRQLEYFASRVKDFKPKNPAGMLRTSIAEDWAEPASYAKMRQEQAQEAKKRKEKDKTRFQQEQTPAWESYVEACMQDIREHSPTLWAEFESWESAARVDATNSAFLQTNESARERIECVFDSASSRRKRALEYFGDRIKAFWDWADYAA